MMGGGAGGAVGAARQAAALAGVAPEAAPAGALGPCGIPWESPFRDDLGVDEALQDVKDTDIVSIAENIEESEDLLDANKAPVIKLVKVVAKEEKALEIGFSVENAKDV